jgi:hypothetical protein
VKAVNQSNLYPSTPPARLAPHILAALLEEVPDRRTLLLILHARIPQVGSAREPPHTLIIEMWIRWLVVRGKPFRVTPLKATPKCYRETGDEAKNGLPQLPLVTRSVYSNASRRGRFGLLRLGSVQMGRGSILLTPTA